MSYKNHSNISKIFRQNCNNNGKVKIRILPQVKALERNLAFISEHTLQYDMIPIFLKNDMIPIFLKNHILYIIVRYITILYVTLHYITSQSYVLQYDMKPIFLKTDILDIVFQYLTSNLRYKSFSVSLVPCLASQVFKSRPLLCELWPRQDSALMDHRTVSMCTYICGALLGRGLSSLPPKFQLRGFWIERPKHTRLGLCHRPLRTIDDRPQIIGFDRHVFL